MKLNKQGRMTLFVVLLIGLSPALGLAQTHPPAATQAPERVVAHLTFTTSLNTHGPVIKARLNDQIDGNLHIDTGAPSCVLTEDMATRLKIAPQQVADNKGIIAPIVFVPTRFSDFLVTVSFRVMQQRSSSPCLVLKWMA